MSKISRHTSDWLNECIRLKLDGFTYVTIQGWEISDTVAKHFIKHGYRVFVYPNDFGSITTKISWEHLTGLN